MKSKEEILNDFGCPEVPFNENVTMYYPAILSAMEEYASQQAPEGMYTREQMMDIAGWMAAADNKRPVSELKEEAEEYIRKIDVAKQFIQSLK